MAKEKNGYLLAMGFGVNTESQNKTFGKWLASKIPAAAGGLFAHEVYDIITTKVFKEVASKYGADIVGSVGLALVAYILDHNLWPLKNKGFSDDFSQSFTDGMMGRGAPAVLNAAKSIYEKIVEFLSPGKTPGQGLIGAPGVAPSLDAAPAALADMMSLLQNSPRTRQLLAEDLISAMEKRDMEVSPQARMNIANCIGDLAQNYTR